MDKLILSKTIVLFYKDTEPIYMRILQKLPKLLGKAFQIPKKGFHSVLTLKSCFSLNFINSLIFARNVSNLPIVRALTSYFK